MDLVQSDEDVEVLSEEACAQNTHRSGGSGFRGISTRGYLGCATRVILVAVKKADGAEDAVVHADFDGRSIEEGQLKRRDVDDPDAVVQEEVVEPRPVDPTVMFDLPGGACGFDNLFSEDGVIRERGRGANRGFRRREGAAAFAIGVAEELEVGGAAGFVLEPDPGGVGTHKVTTGGGRLAAEVVLVAGRQRSEALLKTEPV